MNVVHELRGYDRASELIAVEYLIPAELIPVVRSMVRPEPGDDGLTLAYDMTPENVRRLASMLGMSIDPDLYDYTIEASDGGEEMPVTRDAVTEAR